MELIGACVSKGCDGRYARSITTAITTGTENAAVPCHIHPNPLVSA